MKVAALTSPGEVEVVERERPKPGPGEVLIRLSCVGVCGSDTHYLTQGRIGSFVVDYPIVLGHEAAGVIEQVGAGVDESRVGERVSVEPGVPCRNCEQCLAGRYNLCPRMVFHATPPYDGSLAEYIVHEASFAHPVPDGVSDEAAAMVEPLSVGLWAAQKVELGPADRVLVTGAGPIGLMCALAARAYGVSDVVITDINTERLQRAEGLGFDATNTGESQPEGEFSVLMECTGVAAVIGDAIRSLGRAGRAVLVGMGGDSVAIPLSHVQENEVSVTGIFRYAGTWPTALDLLASGRIQVDELVTGRFGLDQAQQALLAGQSDPASIKAMIYPAGVPADA